MLASRLRADRSRAELAVWLQASEREKSLKAFACEQAGDGFGKTLGKR
jgi:hypothetical protein